MSVLSAFLDAVKKEVESLLEKYNARVSVRFSLSEDDLALEALAFLNDSVAAEKENITAPEKIPSEKALQKKTPSEKTKKALYQAKKSPLNTPKEKKDHSEKPASPKQEAPLPVKRPLPKTPKAKKEKFPDDLCQYVMSRGKKAGERCTSRKSSQCSQNKYCGKHLAADDKAQSKSTPKTPKAKKNPSSPTTKAPPKTPKAKAHAAKEVEQQDEAPIRAKKNTFGNMVIINFPQYQFVVAEDDVVGVQLPNGKIGPLTEEHMKFLDSKELAYVIPPAAPKPLVNSDKKPPSTADALKQLSEQEDEYDDKDKEDEFACTEIEESGDEE